MTLFIIYMVLKGGLSLYIVSYAGNTGIESTSEAFREVESCVRRKVVAHGISEKALKRLNLIYWAVSSIGWFFVFFFALLIAMLIYNAIT